MQTRTTNLPSQLPFLPGNVHADPTITRYHKTQLLNNINGTVQGKFVAPVRGTSQGRCLVRVPSRASQFKLRPPVVVTENNNSECLVCRENHQPEGGRGPRTPALHARRNPPRADRCAASPRAGERRRAPSCPQVAQARPPGKSPSHSGLVPPARSLSNDFIYYNLRVSLIAPSFLFV